MPAMYYLVLFRPQESPVFVGSSVHIGEVETLQKQQPREQSGWQYRILTEVQRATTEPAAVVGSPPLPPLSVRHLAILGKIAAVLQNVSSDDRTALVPYLERLNWQDLRD